MALDLYSLKNADRVKVCCGEMRYFDGNFLDRSVKMQKKNWQGDFLNFILK